MNLPSPDEFVSGMTFTERHRFYERFYTTAYGCWGDGARLEVEAIMRDAVNDERGGSE